METLNRKVFRVQRSQEQRMEPKLSSCVCEQEEDCSLQTERDASFVAQCGHAHNPDPIMHTFRGQRGQAVQDQTSLVKSKRSEGCRVPETNEECRKKGVGRKDQCCHCPCPSCLHSDRLVLSFA